MVMCEANSQELRNYKLTAGLTNYPAAYCTGLLLARRLLTQLNMDTMYAAVEEVNGEKNWKP
jgi:large subunit ribosomal protein L5e